MILINSTVLFRYIVDTNRRAVNNKVTFTITLGDKDEVEKIVLEYFVITELSCPGVYNINS
jgi:hypothetical protein